MSAGSVILVTGGGGYIGSALIPKLLETGAGVRVFDSFLYGRSAIESFISHPRLQVIEGDINDGGGGLEEAVSGAEVVVHLAAIVGDPACDLVPDLALETNVTATRRLARMCVSESVRRFVFASSCSVYGANDGILAESAAVMPMSLYAETKVRAEDDLRDLASESFVPGILRFGTLFGASGRLRFDLVVNTMVATAVAERRIQVRGPRRWRPLLHVDDAAEAIVRTIAAHRRAEPFTYNVAGVPPNYTLGDVARVIESTLGPCEIVESSEGPDPRDYRVDSSKICLRADFKAHWTLSAGVRHLGEVVMSMGPAGYKSDLYSNVRMLASRR